MWIEMPKKKFVDVAECLPLNPAVYHILLTLGEGERHGYAIMQEVREQTGGVMRLGPGTLYRSIQAMLKDRLIEESKSRPPVTQDDERRRYYRLTTWGRKVAAAETARLAKLVRTAESRKLFRGLAPEA
jgi:DNA-binding PadR family transcriptional regulator